MTGSTISSPSAAITSPPASIAPPEPRPSRPGPRSPAWPLGHRRSIGVRVAGLTCLVATRANQVDGAVGDWSALGALNILERVRLQVLGERPNARVVSVGLRPVAS